MFQRHSMLWLVVKSRKYAKKHFAGQKYLRDVKSFGHKCVPKPLHTCLGLPGSLWMRPCHQPPQKKGTIEAPKCEKMWEVGLCMVAQQNCAVMRRSHDSVIYGAYSDATHGSWSSNRPWHLPGDNVDIPRGNYYGASWLEMIDNNYG